MISCGIQSVAILIIHVVEYRYVIFEISKNEVTYMLKNSDWIDGK